MKNLFLIPMIMFIGCSSMKIPDDYAKQWCECVGNAKNDHTVIMECDSVLNYTFRMAMIAQREVIVKNQLPMETYALYLNDYTQGLHKMKSACMDSLIKSGVLDRGHFDGQNALPTLPAMQMERKK
jgi:hypothetical protein